MQHPLATDGTKSAEYWDVVLTKTAERHWEHAVPAPPASQPLQISTSFARTLILTEVRSYGARCGVQGPRMVRDVFRLAKENAPAIIFIDEIDAIATARFDAQTGADREVQRILMELLNQMDGFDQTVNVKV